METQNQQQEEELTTLPEWLDRLLSENFFSMCTFHFNFKKNEKNVFCVDCHCSLCSQCVLSHSSHRLLQVRRYVYHDVIRLEDAQKLIDCSHVQPYISNGCKVVFLNQRPTTRSSSHSGNICASCDRILQDPFLFCSVSCKVDHILDNEGIEALHGYIHKCDFLHLNDVVEVADGVLTPDSVLEPSSVSAVLSSSNSSGCAATNAVVSNTTNLGLASTATTTGSVQFQLFPRKKRTPKFPIIRVDPVVCDESGGPTVCHVKRNVNRRKGMPQRSALA